MDTIAAYLNVGSKRSIETQNNYLLTETHFQLETAGRALVSFLENELKKNFIKWYNNQRGDGYYSTCTIESGFTWSGESATITVWSWSKIRTT